MALGQRAQESPYRLESPPPLYLQTGPPGWRRAEDDRGLGQQRRDRRRVLAEHLPQLLARGAGHDGGDRLHDRLEEQRPFRLVAAGPQHGPAVFGGLGGEELGQRGLPDPRLTDDHHELRLSAGRPVPRVTQGPELAFPADQHRCTRPAACDPGAFARRPTASVGRSNVLLAQDRQMQVARLRGRIDAKLFAQPPLQRRISGQGFRLLTGGGRGRHVPAVGRFVERVGGHGRGRVPGRQPRVPGPHRGLGGDQPQTAQQLAHLFAGRIGPARVRLVADRGAGGQQRVPALGRGQRHRGGGGHLAFGLIAEPGRRIEVDHDARAVGQPVPRSAALDKVGPEDRAEPADQGRDILLRRRRPAAGHKTSTMRSAETAAGLSTASSFRSVRDFRLPISPSASSVPSLMTLNVPARRSSTCVAPTDPAGTRLPTSLSYAGQPRRAREDAWPVPGSSSAGP